MTTNAPSAVDETGEIQELIATLSRTGKRLEELTGGVVDAVTDDAGNVMLLPDAQVRLRSLAITLQEKLIFNDSYDRLTGLANRSRFITRVDRHLAHARTTNSKLAVLLIDLERFKSVNDSLGAAAGDALLVQVAECLTRISGDECLLSRIGLDHFAMVLPEVSLPHDPAGLLMQTIQACLSHAFVLAGAEVCMAAKVGVALFPDDALDAELLLKSAETALKKTKKTCQPYLFYTQRMTEVATTRLTLESHLRQALDNDEFMLHYQPKICLKSGTLTGAEALIRWNNPRVGLVPPDRFIPVLEETGMIYQVGNWALRKAVDVSQRWRAAGHAAVPIAVNVSPLQLHNPNFVSEIRQIASSATQAAGLELEITESVIMENVGYSIDSLRAIRDIGLAIAIDDFGTGFSSLAYLSKLPVDILKIDRAFVTNMTASPRDLALLSNIIKLAHAMGMKVVAEGVKTEQQASLLELLGCNEIQGFLFSKPVPEDVFETMFLACSSSCRRPPVWKPSTWFDSAPVARTPKFA